MANILFTEDHEWIAVEGGVATVGITIHAQEQLGDLVYVELPEVGRTFSKGESLGVVESVKVASDVYAPVDGEVVEINEAAAADPALHAGPRRRRYLPDHRAAGDLLPAAVPEQHRQKPVLLSPWPRSVISRLGRAASTSTCG